MNVTYASYTYEHPNFLVSFPHRRRFELLKRLIGRRPVRRWLDYGTGDGEVYYYYARHAAPVEAVLYEPVRRFYDQAAAKLDPNLPCTLVERIDEISGQFDLVTAFEVLEHLPLPERIRFFQTAARLLFPDGRILLEVPVEIGPVLLLKEWGRRVLKGRTSDYGTGELLSAALLGKVEDSLDRYNIADRRTVITPHQGFDVNRFAREISRIGTIIDTHNSPIRTLPSWVNQCRIFEFRLECRDPDEIAAVLKP